MNSSQTRNCNKEKLACWMGQAEVLVAMCVSVRTCVEGVIGAGGIVGPNAIDSDGGLGAIVRCCPVICPC